MRNRELELANDYVLHTGCSLFLTGRAGTGKTTFLHDLGSRTAKRMIITAPTGVAAINAGGVTLHSFFQLPFGPFLPGGDNYDQRRHRFSRDKRNIIVNLDLLVIDEISMVRADMLDGVDEVLRRFRRSEQPFGGVQLLMIGDLHQLPPVVKDDEWELLSRHYDSPYFFSSQALARTELVTIELQHVYRQSDRKFIDLLNRVRDNRMDQDTLAALNSRCRPDVSGQDEGYITLCSHNRNADAINRSRLAEIDRPLRRFKAKVEGDFPEYTFPTSAVLELKVGAQVMFVRNDASEERRYFNGRIGRVTGISGKVIRVHCPGDEHDIEVEPVVWENIKYTADEQSGEIRQEKIGAFLQYPLKLAWAITIHKSQGLTFDRAIIDANQAFAHGQVYVALSRCRTFEGLILSSPISPQAVQTDQRVLGFVEQARQNPPTPEHLEAARLHYQRQLMLECFDLGRLRYWLGRLIGTLFGNAHVLQITGQGDMQQLRQRCEDEIFTVSENFRRQLGTLFESCGLPESDPVLVERASKASAYFEEKFKELPVAFLENLAVEADSRELKKRVSRAMEETARELAVRRAGIASCAEGFAPARYLRAISAAAMEAGTTRQKKKTTVEYTADDVGHPELFEELRRWRAAKAAEEDVPAYRILHQRVLIQIAVLLPATLSDLRKVKGIGKRLAERYGEELVAMVSAYREKHDIQEVILPQPSGGAKKPDREKPWPGHKDTRSISFDLLQQGLSIPEIARKRGLAVSTIEGHMVRFIEQGELAIDTVLAPERREVIEKKIQEMPDRPFGEIKKSLRDEYSYGEIKMVMAHLRHRKTGDKES